MEFPTFVYGQIYLATNIKTWKQYVGQVRSHYRNHDNWVEAGYQKRWRAHLSEASRAFKYESAKLNRSIRKYGNDVFVVELIHTCPIIEIDQWEIYFIDALDTYRYGYNLTPGGKCGQPLQSIREQISDKLVRISDDTRLSLLEGKEIVNVKISRINSCGLDIVSLTFRTISEQYIKVDFGGKLRSFQESLDRAIKFELLVINEEKIIVQQCLQPMVNLPKSQSDDRLLQNSNAQKKALMDRYELLKSLHIISIRIEKRMTSGTILATLVINTDSKKKYVSFGGKLVKFEESLENAVVLALLLVDKNKIIMQQGLKHESIN
jgi:hypothetical protein